MYPLSKYWMDCHQECELNSRGLPDKTIGSTRKQKIQRKMH